MDQLKAIEIGGEIKVADNAGGIWHPKQEAAEQIQSAQDRVAEAIRICKTQPMRGTWHS